MSGYAYIENNEIKEIHYVLPRNWRNVSNFYVLNNDELRTLNWYPIVDSDVAYDNTKQRIVDYTFKINDNQVDRIFILEDIPEPTVVDVLVNDADSSLFDDSTLINTSETTTEVTIDTSVNESTEN